MCNQLNQFFSGLQLTHFLIQRERKPPEKEQKKALAFFCSFSGVKKETSGLLWCGGVHPPHTKGLFYLRFALETSGLLWFSKKSVSPHQRCGGFIPPHQRFEVYSFQTVSLLPFGKESPFPTMRVPWPKFFLSWFHPEVVRIDAYSFFYAMTSFSFFRSVFSSEKPDLKLINNKSKSYLI